MCVIRQSARCRHTLSTRENGGIFYFCRPRKSLKRKEMKMKKIASSCRKSEDGKSSVFRHSPNRTPTLHVRSCNLATFWNEMLSEIGRWDTKRRRKKWTAHCWASARTHILIQAAAQKDIFTFSTPFHYIWNAPHKIFGFMRDFQCFAEKNERKPTTTYRANVMFSSVGNVRFKTHRFNSVEIRVEMGLGCEIEARINK